VIAEEKHEKIAFSMHKVLSDLGPFKIDRLALEQLKDNIIQLTVISSDFHEVSAKERMDCIVSAIGD
jgi:hypothetical protein